MIGNLTLRPHQFTKENVKNPDFDGFSVGILIESNKIDEAIDRTFSHFNESYLKTAVMCIVVLGGVAFLLGTMYA